MLPLTPGSHVKFQQKRPGSWWRPALENIYEGTGVTSATDARPAYRVGRNYAIGVIAYTSELPCKWSLSFRNTCSLSAVAAVHLVDVAVVQKVQDYFEICLPLPNLFRSGHVERMVDQGPNAFENPHHVR